jgi:hypothetical protein
VVEIDGSQVYGGKQSGIQSKTNLTGYLLFFDNPGRSITAGGVFSTPWPGVRPVSIWIRIFPHVYASDTNRKILLLTSWQEARMSSDLKVV